MYELPIAEELPGKLQQELSASQQVQAVHYAIVLKDKE
jgi:hypothetical protein